MPREAISFGKPENLPSGKVRYKKMFKGKQWKSQAYDQDSRRNRSEAWGQFLEWRDEIDQELQQEELTIKSDDPIRLMRELALDVVDTQAENARILGNNDQAAFWESTKSNIPKLPKEKIFEFINLMYGNIDPQYAVPETFEDVRQHAEGTVKQHRKNVPEKDKEFAAGKMADEYLSRFKRKARNNRGSFGQYGLVRSALKRFREWFGEHRSMTHISEQTVSTYTNHLEKQADEGKISHTTAKQYQKEFRAFIEALAEDNPSDIPYPRNLRSKRLTIQAEAKEPNPFTIDEAKLFLENATEKTKLYLLLMLNCGFYQSDIADLKSDEIDWESGRIIRPRSKTTKTAKTKGKTPPLKVNWLLWDQTWDLLQKHGNREGTVLLNENGELLVQHNIGEDGSERRNDNIDSAFDRLLRKLKNRELIPKDFNKTLKQLRKTGANLLEKSEDHAEFYQLYLDQSSVAKRHYLTRGDQVPRFDMAVIWLGNQLGLGTTRRPAK